MSGAELFVDLVKIISIVLFLLSAAALGTWADRRQGAMVQDRVGPNRAVVYLPSYLARLIVLLPACLLGAAALLPILRDMRGPFAAEALSVTSQGAVLVLWLGALLLGGLARRDGAANKLDDELSLLAPRMIFYSGVAAHAVVFAITSSIPPDAVPLAAKVSGAVLAGLLFLAGIYTSSQVPDGKVGMRLAGMLHPLADAIKMIWKEDFIPKNADRLLHGLAPMLAMFPALVTFAVIPFGDAFCVGGDPRKPLTFHDFANVAPAMARDGMCRGHVVNLQIADLNVGILYLFGMAGTGIVGAALAGWASDNKFSLLGGLRAASQMVSYEVAMGLSLVGLFIIYSNVRLGPMVQWQGDNAWGIFVQPLAFVLFLVAITAETKRIPFDSPEGESEIVAGYFVEYSGMKFGMFFTGEYAELITSSALLVTLFFGGYQLPFLHRDGITLAFGDTMLFAYKMNHVAVTLISIAAFFGKTIFMVWFQIFFRWTLPRFRYDQLMKLGWTKLLPLALANILLTGLVVLAVDSASAGVASALRLLADVSQGLVALAAAAGFVALVVGLLEPVERKRVLQSTATRFAAAVGGTKASPQQA